jgi:hypothetical protein
MSQNPAMATLEVEADYFPLAFIYSLFTPTIEINGVKEKRKWGTHTFQLQPGFYLVSVSYPWLFNNESGKNSVSFTIAAGEKRKVTYRALAIRTLAGNISLR